MTANMQPITHSKERTQRWDEGKPRFSREQSYTFDFLSVEIFFGKEEVKECESS